LADEKIIIMMSKSQPEGEVDRKEKLLKSANWWHKAANWRKCAKRIEVKKMQSIR
jgi:hypothetical protein